LLDFCRLKLYPTDGTALALDRPVIDDHYDEIVFNSLPPDAAVRAALEAGACSQSLRGSCVQAKPRATSCWALNAALRF
jgi:hypothetical protein